MADEALLRPTIWPAGCHFDRLHAKQLGAAEFNPGFGQARFSPLMLTALEDLADEMALVLID